MNPHFVTQKFSFYSYAKMAGGRGVEGYVILGPIFIKKAQRFELLKKIGREKHVRQNAKNNTRITFLKKMLFFRKCMYLFSFSIYILKKINGRITFLAPLGICHFSNDRSIFNLSFFFSRTQNNIFRTKRAKMAFFMNKINKLQKNNIFSKMLFLGAENNIFRGFSAKGNFTNLIKKGGYNDWQ